MLRIVIPARMGSSRLPFKMVQKIGSKTLVERAIEQVRRAAGPREIILATDDRAIAAFANWQCAPVLTSANCRCGSDRCAEVADIMGFQDDDIVVNVQADMPFLAPEALGGFLDRAEAGGDWDLLTAYCTQQVVEVQVGRFSRGTVDCHVGLYAFSRPALRRFAKLESSQAELELRLEQMRAIDNGFRVAFHRLDEMPFEVNTPADLAAAQRLAECFA